MRPLLLTLLVLALAGCQSETPEQAGAANAADMAASLRVGRGWSTRGCGDILLVGRNAADTRAFFVNLNGMAQASHTSGAVHRSFTLPSSEVSVSAQDGLRLTSATCVGAQPFPGPRVTRAWEAVSGTVTVDVVPTGSSPSASASITARNVVFEDGTGLRFTATAMRVPATSVGYYPP